MQIEINQDERDYLFALLNDILIWFVDIDSSSIQEDIKLVRGLIKKIIGEEIDTL